MNIENYSKVAHVHPAPGGTFEFETEFETKQCQNKDVVGENLEELLWPLVEPLLSQGIGFNLTIKPIWK